MAKTRTIPSFTSRRCGYIQKGQQEKSPSAQGSVSLGVDCPDYSVARVLLSSPPFSRLPLHIRFFTLDARDHYTAAAALSIIKDIPLDPVPQTLTTILDLGGVSGSKGRDNDVPGTTSRDGPIDVTDASFRDDAWQQWQEENHDCTFCSEHLEVSTDSSRLTIEPPR